MSKVSKLARFFILGSKRHNQPLVNVVKLQGVITANTPSRSPQNRRTISPDKVDRWLQRAFSKRLDPVAVSIVINSPGGAPAASEMIFNKIRELSSETKIPVFTFAEDVAASGGYWLLCAGQNAYALRTSIVGSIGVISSSFGAMDLAQKLGIERRVWTAGEHKLPMDPFLPVTTDQEDRLTHVLHDLHKSFKDAVKSSRGDRLKIETAEKENDVFSGRVWTGNQAVEAGCIDGIGSVGSTMKATFGDNVVLRLCSDVPQPGLRDFLGFSNSRSSAHSYFNRTGLFSLEEAATTAARAAIEATVQEVEDMELWSRYKMYL